ncbi:MAG: sigma-70 family RNA polymerase sigma factor [Candidatus Hinthialibacter antarcticus]|nr:sigma-70 family RNA polymerase sigma factor [Candidatus Hinthialibacter antarcticus]
MSCYHSEVKNDAHDAHLIQQYLSGDFASFEALFSRHNDVLFRFVVSLGGPLEQAEDVVQRSWIQAVEHLHEYEDRGRFRSWLFRIAHRIWLNEVFTWWSRNTASMDGADGRDGPPLDHAVCRETPRNIAEKNEASEAFYQALNELSDELRRTVLLRIDAELTFQEIADEMQCPLGTALWRMKEAEKRLKAKLRHSEYA